MITLGYRTLVAFLAGVALTIVAGFALQGWRADAAPGDDDTTFVPMTPCRLIDTRPAPDRVGPHDTFGAADTRTIVAHGTNGNCTIPTEAAGLSLNVTAVDATAATFLTIWPDGQLPLASSLNPYPGEPPTPNAVATNLATSGSFNIYNLDGNVDVIVDVNGYHTDESLHELASDIADLRRAQPFAVTAFAGDATDLTDTPTSYVNVSIAAPVAGHVTVNSTASFSHNVNGGGALCLITQSAAIPTTISGDLESFHNFERGGLGNAGTISATRTFTVSGRGPVGYVLACEESPDGGRIYARNLTAIFTPAP